MLPKGLEFPVVVLTGLNSGGGNRSESVLFDRDTGDVEVGIGSKSGGNRFATAGYEEKAERENALDDDEHVRLLYVATTRARDHLVLSMHRPGSRNSGMDATQIAAMLEGSDELWERVELRHEYQAMAMAQGALEAAQSQQPFDGAAHTVEARDEWERRRRDVLSAQGQAGVGGGDFAFGCGQGRSGRRR